MAPMPTEDEFENEHEWSGPSTNQGIDVVNDSLLQQSTYTNASADEEHRSSGDADNALLTGLVCLEQRPIDEGLPFFPWRDYQGSSEVPVQYVGYRAISMTKSTDQYVVYRATSTASSANQYVGHRAISVTSSTEAHAGEENRDYYKLDFDIGVPNKDEFPPAHTDSGYASLPHESEKAVIDLQTNAPVDFNDDVTVYSTASSSSLGTVAKHSYIEIMAQLLWKEFDALQIDDLPPKDVSDILCDLLGQFALRLGDNTSSDMHKRIMVFIHKYRRDIASEFEKIKQHQQKDENYHPTTDGKPGMSVADKMAFWEAGAEKSNFEWESTEQSEINELPQTIEISEAKRQHEVVEFYEANEANEPYWIDHEEDRGLMADLESLITNDPSYEWLVRRLKRAILYTTSDVQAAISSTITKRIRQGQKISRRMEILESDISVYLDWDLQSFVQEQLMVSGTKGRQNALHLEPAEKFITITGSPFSEYQALTCGEYLESIWPELGREVLHAIQKIISSNTGDLVLKDGTRMSAVAHNGGMLIQLGGVIHAIAEVAEILSWLAAALRTSEEGIITCLPAISEIPLGEKHTPFLSFKIGYSFQTLKPQGEGQCWQKMFRSSTIVLGYPIRRRTTLPGLEISLPVLSKLLCSNRMNVFNGKLILKAFSAMLIPTDQTKDFVYWHYLYEQDGNYLDFSVASSFDGAGVSGRDMAKRHIVGWCSDAKVIAGAPGPYYSIQRSRLPKCDAGIALKSFSLSAGTQPGAMLEASVAIGVKDRPLHVSPAGLGIVDKLRWLSQRYVVLYDNEEKRGWLINGVNALHHLLRASLESYYTDKFSSVLKLKPSDIVEPTTDYPDASIDFFLQDDHKNLQLELYTKRFESFIETTKNSTTPGVPKLKATSVLVQDRVEDLFDILAHAITQQVEMACREGIYFRHFKKFLDGWDFKNIALDCSIFEPVSANLDCFQQPWVNMIRALHIPVLFGRNFGEIIQPANADQTCARWTSLPKGKNYLAATVATMREIIERHGDDSTSPMRICENMLWFHPSSSHAACKCHIHKNKRHIDNVQVIWPEGLKSKLLHHVDINLPANGAIVFGKNTRFNWFRNDHGVPTRGNSHPCRSENHDEEDDVEPDLPVLNPATQTSQSLTTPSSASEGNDSNILTNSPASQESTDQTNPSLTQQVTGSSSSSSASQGNLQSTSDLAVRPKRKASLSWLKSSGKRRILEDRVS